MATYVATYAAAFTLFLLVILSEAKDLLFSRPALHSTRMSTRIDKWLWAARFFKTRTQATRACELTRVQCAQQPVKPSREVHIGDRLQIRTEGGEFEIDVLGLSDVRGPASAAQTLYRETDASREARRKVAAERKAFMHFTPAPQSRPSKRDRRKLNQFRGRP
jgi:ribosome-associated heat shock protein Hsp15